MSIPGRLADALADRYVIERELGAGGMATVYRARDVRHDGHVGLKVMRPALTAVIGAERFLREVKTTAGFYDRCGGLYGVAWGSDADCFARNDDSAAGGEVAGVAGECVTEGVGDRVDIVRPVSVSRVGARLPAGYAGSKGFEARRDPA
jgi:hypothetical protein